MINDITQYILALAGTGITKIYVNKEFSKLIQAETQGLFTPQQEIVAGDTLIGTYAGIQFFEDDGNDWATHDILSLSITERCQLVGIKSIENCQINWDSDGYISIDGVRSHTLQNMRKDQHHVD